jgi:hypothetical protein
MVRVFDAKMEKLTVHTRLEKGQYTLRDLRRWLESPQEQETFSFLQQHELIRNPHSYDSLAKTGDLFN